MHWPNNNSVAQIVSLMDLNRVLNMMRHGAFAFDAVQNVSVDRRLTAPWLRLDIRVTVQWVGIQ